MMKLPEDCSGGRAMESKCSTVSADQPENKLPFKHPKVIFISPVAPVDTLYALQCHEGDVIKYRLTTIGEVKI